MKENEKPKSLMEFSICFLLFCNSHSASLIIGKFDKYMLQPLPLRNSKYQKYFLKKIEALNEIHFLGTKMCCFSFP